MAWATKYRMEWTDQFGSADTYKVDIDEDGYGGSVIGLGHSPTEGFVIDYNDEDWVVGSEAIFSFHVDEDDVSNYDADFYDSTYKQFKVKFYKNGSLNWVGWLKPENTTREFELPVVIYRVSATDGLKDLQNVDYDGFEDSGKQSFLQLVKNAMTLIGIDDLDFFIQCNLSEDTTSTTDVFTGLQGDNRVFYSIDDGETVPDTGYEVIEKSIKHFYCKMYQANGYWKIVNGQEHDSESTTYDYDTLSPVTGEENVSYDRQVDISAYDYPVNSPPELSKQSPLGKLRLIFRNKNLGDNEIGTNPDFEDGGNPPTGWTNSGWDQFITTTEDGNKVGNTTETTTNSDEKYIEASSFTLTGVDSESDSLNVTFKVKLKSITLSSGTEYPAVVPALVDPNSDEVRGWSRYINEVDGGYTTIEHSFGLTIDGVYKLRLYIIPRDPTSQLTYYWDDAEAIHAATTNTTTDSLYISTPSVSGYEVKEEIINFADSLQTSDLGAITDGATLTDSWTRYGQSAENLKLRDLFSQQYLNDRQAYHSVLTLQLYDLNEELSYNSILTYDSKKYRWIEMSKNYVTKLVTGTIVEVDNSSDVSFTISNINLTSVNGVSAPSSQSATGATQDWVNSQLGNYAHLAQDEIVTGYYDFTHASGVKVGGTSFTASDIANWNTAFGWGDHGLEGYVTATVSVAEGGTGGTSFGTNNILLGQGTSPITSVGQNTAFNKSFGTTAGTVAEGSHNHDADYVDVSGDTMIGALYFSATATARLIDFTGNSTNDDRGIYFNNRVALSADYNDGWLRLNNNEDFTNGVYTPNLIRADGGFIVGSNDRGIQAVTGTYGTVQTQGSGVGGYEGYSINGRVVFMENGSGVAGLYNDVNNEWMIQTNLNGNVKLYYNGSLKLETATDGIDVTGEVRASGEVEAYDTSDIKLKKNIKELESTLSTLAKLRPVRYFNKKHQRNEIGLISQNVKEHYPEFVKYDDGGYQMLNYGKMIALCIKGINELHDLIKEK